MSPSVKSHYLNKNCDYYAPTINCGSMNLRFYVMSLVLITNLVHALPPEDPRWYSGSHYHRNHNRYAQTRGSFNSIQDDNSKSKNSDFRFKSPDFEVNFEVFHKDDDEDKKNDETNTAKIPQVIFESDKELVTRSLQKNILLGPEKFAKSNHQSKSISEPGIITHGKRIGDNEVEIPPPETFVPQVPPECESATMCENAESYPTDYIRDRVENMKELKLLAGVDPVNSVSGRISGGDGGSLCQSEQKLWFPTIIRKNPSEDKWQFVANVDTFKQGFLIETCSSAGGQCRKVGSITENLESGYAAVCKQQEGPRKVVVLNRENGTMMIDSFPVKTGCCCHIDSISSRFGGITNNSVHPFSLLRKHGRSPKLD